MTMNDHAFCFIACYNDKVYLKETQLYISMLDVPEGYTTDFISIEGAESMTAGYNAAMQASDAKYKIYLHQDVFILNRYFLHNLLGIFQADPAIGMVGMIGAIQMGTDGIMFNAPRIGMIASEENLRGAYISERIAKECRVRDVAAVDGMLIATQVDVPWREDIFTGWDFYDASVSFEFWRNGYRVVVPDMKAPWILHDDGKILNWFHYDEYRKVFLKEYGTELEKYPFQKAAIDTNTEAQAPLISVVIPTYNRANTICRAIDSVLGQTYPNLEIVVVDDASTDQTLDVLQDRYGDEERILYIRNDQNLGAGGSRNAGVVASHGTWIAFLDSDDEWMVSKLEKQMAALEECNATVAFCQMQYEGSKVIWPPTQLLDKINAENILPYILVYPLCGTPSLLVKREVYEASGGFNAELPVLEDYDLSIRLALASKVVFVKEPLANVHVTENSISSRSKDQVVVQGLLTKIYMGYYKQNKLLERKLKRIAHEAEEAGIGLADVKQILGAILADDTEAMQTLQRMD